MQHHLDFGLATFVSVGFGFRIKLCNIVAYAFFVACGVYQRYKTMAQQMKLWTMDTDFAIPEFYNRVKVVPDETYAILRARLEEKQAIEWPFDFWDNESYNRIR